MLQRSRFILPLLFLVIGSATLLATSLSAQTATPDANGQFVFKANARNVVVDVVVTGRNGKPVEGLSKDDFVVAEDGHPQALTYFEEHTSAQTGGPAKLPPLPQNVFSNIPRVKPSGAVTVLLLDSMNTQLQDQAIVHSQMLKYLKTIPPGTRMAIFVLGARLRFIQGFTDDASLLAAALRDPKFGGASQTSPLLQSKAEDLTEQEDIARDEIYFGAMAPQMIASMKQFLAEKDAFQADQRVQATLTAMQELAYYLAGISGRKNVIWFSSSVPLVLYPNADLMDPFGTQRDYQKQVHLTSTLLAAAQVAIYPIAAEGLMADSANQASESRVDVRTAEQTGVHLLNQQGDDATTRNSNHATMLAIAQDTGGAAFINKNALGDAVARVVNQSSNFYTLTYAPTKSDNDGKFRQIQVKLSKGSSGYTLAYRRGYYADEAKELKAAAAKLPTDPLRPFMGAGMPSSTQIPILVRLQREPPQTSAAKPAGDNPNLKSPATLYKVDFDIPASGLVLEPGADGSRHGEVEAALVVYDSDARPLNWMVRTFNLDMDAARYAVVQQRGANLTLEIDVPAGGATLRSGILDSNSHLAGTLEVPLSSVVDPTPAGHL